MRLPIGVPGLVWVINSLSSLDSILNLLTIRSRVQGAKNVRMSGSNSSSSNVKIGSRVERARGEDVGIGRRLADHALLDVVFDKRVDGRLVGFDAVFPRIAPCGHLLFHSLAQVDDREAAAVAQDIVVGDLLWLFQKRRRT